MSTTKKLYAGEKKKGLFHHSSFLAGGATLAAGWLVAEDGVLKSISAYSERYKPTEDRLDSFVLFLIENGVSLDEVEIVKSTENASLSEVPPSAPNDLPNKDENSSSASHPASKAEFKRTISGGLQSPETDVPKSAILQRINSKNSAKSYQLGHQLSVKWSTGAGPRIGCVANYPIELRLQALELTNLSPRPQAPLSTLRRNDALVSPSDCSLNPGTEDSLDSFLLFLKENGASLDEVGNGIDFRWQKLNSAGLDRGPISSFNFVEPETAASGWNRACLRASKVGKGLSKDAKAFEHWIEAIDPRHRCGRSLHFYYNEWRETNSGQPFFYWLDVGDGKEVDLDECPRSKLCQQFIKYLEPKERAHYEFLVVDGKILHKRTGKPLDTNQRPTGSKWIFVLSTSKRLYTGVEKKGLFHHSSFLAGPRTLAAGKLVAEDGVLKSISAYSVHYGPTLDRFLSFLKENGVNLDEVEIEKENGKSTENASISPFCSK